MAMIQFEGVSFTYPGSFVPVFENCSIVLDTDWRCGLIGRNGRGKTTLLKLLMKQIIGEGRIINPIECIYFPYEIKDKGQITEQLLQSLCIGIERWQWLKEFSYLELKDDCLDRPFDSLSSGEQTKVLLIALFMNQGMFYLIDEPTNHLDTQSRQLVAQYLSQKIGFIVVSHDRDFLNRCVDHIVSINQTSIDIQSGNFASWKTNYDRKLQYEHSQNERYRQDIKRLKKASLQTSVWSEKVEATKIGQGGVDRGYIGHKAAKMMKRSKTLEHRTQKAIEAKTRLLKDLEPQEELKLHPLVHRKHRLVSFSNVVVKYDYPINSPVTFDLNSGDRLIIDGRNGSGKSSLVRLLINQSLNFEGEISISSNCVLSFVPQDTSFLHGTLGDFILEYQLSETLFKAILRKLGFDRTQFNLKIENYSQGQKKKVLIAKSLCEEAHVYVWDEPLNYIDIDSREQIEKLILEFKPTMILIEHDATFQNLIATKKISLD